MIPDPVIGIVSGFRPISLLEADCVKLMTRTDEKYICPLSLLPALLEKAQPDFRVLEVNGTRIQDYETTYFDTAGHRMYHDHHNGRQNRYKIRMREYLSSHDRYLEIKRKDNRGNTEKKRIPMLPGRDFLNPEQGEFISRLSPFETVGLKPVLVSSFSRITLVSTDMPQRITLDLHPAWRNEHRSASLPGVVIIEVKSTANTSYAGFGYLLREERLKPMRVSKYCMGTCLVYPELKHNRFKLKLLYLQKINKISETNPYDHSTA